MSISLVELANTLAASTLAQAAPGGVGGGSAGGGSGGEAIWLMSPIKPILFILPLLGWAWIVSTVYDKDAERWYMKRRAWNLTHIGFAIAGVLLFLAIPSFWIGWPVLVATLGADLLLYAVHHNRSSSVPETMKWSFDLEKMKEARANREAAKLAKGVTLSFKGPNGVVQAPEKNTPEFDIRVAAESILIDATEARATRVELLAANESSYQANLLVDGVRQKLDPIPTKQAVAIIDFFKSASGMDVQDRRRRVTKDLQVEQAGGKRTLRLVASGGSSGMKLLITFDPEDQVKLPLDSLGLLPQQKTELDALVQQSQGAVLVASPPLGGRTTTLYALIQAHDAYTSNVQTVELEPQATLEGVRHNVFNPLADGAEYSTTVRSILRRDPDIVAIGELPDSNTAIEVTRADQERTRTYVGIKADNGLAAIQTFCKAVGDPKTAASCLHGVVAVKLVRKLCLNCRIEYAPSPELLKKLGAPPDKIKKLYKKGGQVLIKSKPEICPVCAGAGYFGQEGVFEVYSINEEERAMIASNDLIALRSSFRKRRMPSMQEAMIMKAASGATSVEEVARVSSSGQRKKAPPQQKPAGAA